MRFIVYFLFFYSSILFATDSDSFFSTKPNSQGNADCQELLSSTDLSDLIASLSPNRAIPQASQLTPIDMRTPSPMASTYPEYERADEQQSLDAILKSANTFFSTLKDPNSVQLKIFRASGVFAKSKSKTIRTKNGTHRSKQRLWHVLTYMNERIHETAASSSDPRSIDLMIPTLIQEAMSYFQAHGYGFYLVSRSQLLLPQQNFAPIHYSDVLLRITDEKDAILGDYDPSNVLRQIYRSLVNWKTSFKKRSHHIPVSTQEAPTEPATEIKLLKIPSLAEAEQKLKTAIIKVEQFLNNQVSITQEKHENEASANSLGDLLNIQHQYKASLNTKWEIAYIPKSWNEALIVESTVIPPGHIALRRTQYNQNGALQKKIFAVPISYLLLNNNS